MLVSIQFRVRIFQTIKITQPQMWFKIKIKITYMQNVFALYMCVVLYYIILLSYIMPSIMRSWQMNDIVVSHSFIASLNHCLIIFRPSVSGGQSTSVKTSYRGLPLDPTGTLPPPRTCWQTRFTNRGTICQPSLHWRLWVDNWLQRRYCVCCNKMSQ